MTEPLNPEQLRSFTPLNVLSEQQWRELRPGEVAALRNAASKKQAGGLSE